MDQYNDDGMALSMEENSLINITSLKSKVSQHDVD